MSKKDSIQNLDNYILPISGEKYVKIYNCINLTDSTGEGLIGISNERLVFVSKSKTSKESSTTIYEIPIYDVGAIRSGFGRSINIKKKNIGTSLLVIGLLIAAVSAVAMFTEFLLEVADFAIYGFILAAVVAIAGIIVLSGNVKRQFYVEICTNKPISTFFLAKSFGLSSNDVNVIYASPTKETSNMLKEIGSVIATAKKMNSYPKEGIDTHFISEEEPKEEIPSKNRGKKIPLEEIPPLPKEGKKIRVPSGKDPFDKPVTPISKSEDSNPFKKQVEESSDDNYDDIFGTKDKNPLERSAFGSIINDTRKDEDEEEK
jgi:hypothetical protein